MLQFAGFVINAVYSVINSGASAGSPGWGWSMGPSYAKLVEEPDSQNRSGPTYLDFYDGSGAYERYTINNSGSTPTYQALYSDNYATLVQNTNDNSFTMSFPDLSQMNFAPLGTGSNPGKITSSVDLNKNTMTYNYTGSQVSSINDGEGRTLYFTYGPDGQPTQVSMQIPGSSTNPVPDHYVNFKYMNPTNSNPASFNPLLQITDSMNNSQYFTYTSSNQLAARWDTRNNPANSGSVAMVSYVYYSSGPYTGKIYTETHDTGLVLTYTYANVMAADGTTDLLIGIEEQDTVSMPTPANRYTVTRYNQWSQPVASWGPTTTTLDLTDYASGEYSSPFVGGAGAIEWTFQYQDPLNPYLMTQMVDPNLNATNWVFDNYGNTTQMTNAAGNLYTYQYGSNVSPYLVTQITPPLITAAGDSGIAADPGPTSHPTMMAYDNVGNLSSITDAAQQQIVFQRNNLHPSGGPNAGVSDGRITGIVDRNNNTTTIQYTQVGVDNTNTGNIKSVTPPAGAAMTGMMSFTYDTYDNRLTASDSINSVSYNWDNLQRLLAVIPTLANTSTALAYVMDRLDHVTLPDTAGLSGGVGGSSGGRKTSFQYDTPSRLLEVDSQINASTTQARVKYAYDGWSNLNQLSRLQSGVTRSYNFGYDALDRTISMTGPAMTDGIARTTTNSYQPYCLSYKQTTPRGIQRTYTFDSLCRMASMETGDEYNTVMYDAWGQVIQITHQPSEFSSATNPSAPGLARFGSARFSGPNAAQVKNITYDKLGRVAEVLYPNGKNIQYGYDLEGNVTSILDTNSILTTYTYYSDYKLKSVAIGSGSNPPTFQYSYDGAGRLLKIVYPTTPNQIVAWFYNPANGTSQPTNGWDANGRLLGLLYTLNGNPLQSFAYTYDNAGNRSQIVDSFTFGGSTTTTTWNYGYDWLGRLAGADYNNGTTRNVYNYDESDNRTSVQALPANVTQDYTYQADNELQYRYLNGQAQTSGDAWSSDLDGNLASKAVAGAASQYVFNDSNKLVRIQSNGVTETESYDAEGMRESTDPSTLYYDSGSDPLTDSNPSGPISFIQGHQLLGLQENGNFYFYLTDHLSSVRHVVDITGTVKYSFSYTEFGSATPINRTVPGDPSYLPALCQMLTYVGASGVRNDPSSEMYLMGQRWYDPNTGTFISQDPIGFNGGLNLYGYVGQQPTKYIDPNGLFMFLPAGVASDFITSVGAGVSRIAIADAAVDGGLLLEGLILASIAAPAIAAVVGTATIAGLAAWAFSSSSPGSSFGTSPSSASQSPGPMPCSDDSESRRRKRYRIVGLGLDQDLRRHMLSGAIIYKNGGWQRNQLTSVPWILAQGSLPAFQESFIEATANADAIRFDVTSYVKGQQSGITTWELNTIANSTDLQDKTTYLKNGSETSWSGGG